MYGQPLKRLFAILVAVAFFHASMLQAMPAAAMQASADMTMATYDGNPDSSPMPCKGMTPTCMIDLGCIFMIAAPVPASQVIVRVAWSTVSYQWPSVAIKDGRIRAPDLRPPIRLI